MVHRHKYGPGSHGNQQVAGASWEGRGAVREGLSDPWGVAQSCYRQRSHLSVLLVRLALFRTYGGGQEDFRDTIQGGLVLPHGRRGRACDEMVFHSQAHGLVPDSRGPLGCRLGAGILKEILSAMLRASFSKAV